MNIAILILIFIIYTFVAVGDWKTGLISLLLNFSILGLSIVYTVINKVPLSYTILKLLIFVLPFIIIETVYQIFFNKEKDDEKFLIGGGDILLFTSMSLVLNVIGMMIMFFFSSLSSLIVSMIVKTKRIPFAPFLEFGFLMAILIVAFVF